MAKLLLIVCALIAGGVAVAQAETTTAQTPAVSAQSSTTPDTQSPPARLIKPRPGHSETHPATERAHRPVDERCKPLKDQLETALQQKPGNQHRVFQARLAHNAGTRFCREGNADKGIAELQRGLSYLQETPH